MMRAASRAPRCAAWLALALLAAGLPACAAAAAPARVEVTEAWVRATVEGQSGSGAYMRLRSREDARLVGASSPVADKVEIHEMRVVDDRMTMRRIESLALPAHTTVALERGLHVMLIGLHRALQPGQTVPLTLHLRDASGAAFDVGLAAPVRPLNTPLGRD
jgi:hypothetical protein